MKYVICTGLECRLGKLSHPGVNAAFFRALVGETRPASRDETLSFLLPSLLRGPKECWPAWNNGPNQTQLYYHR